MSVCVRACASEKVYYQRSLEKYQGQQQNGELFSSTFFDSMIFFVLLESLGLYRIFSGATPRIISLLPFFFSFFFLVYCTFNTRRGSSKFFFFLSFSFKGLIGREKAKRRKHFYHNISARMPTFRQLPVSGIAAPEEKCTHPGGGGR